MVRRFSQAAFISSWQLDVAEITQFNTHRCCVIMAALLSRWETSHLLNSVALLFLCKLLALGWRRSNSHCPSPSSITLDVTFPMPSPPFCSRFALRQYGWIIFHSTPGVIRLTAVSHTHDSKSRRRQKHWGSGEAFIKWPQWSLSGRKTARWLIANRSLSYNIWPVERDSISLLEGSPTIQQRTLKSYRWQDCQLCGFVLLKMAWIFPSIQHT